MISHGTEGANLQHYLNVLRRRKWIVLQAIVIAPLVAVLFSLRQEHLYRASAEVLINTKDLSVLLVGGGGGTFRTAERIADTEANLAQVPDVAIRTLRAAGVKDRTPAEFLARSSVKPKPDADLLTFSVTDPIPALAARLATAYARAFTAYRTALDTGTLQRARREVASQLKQLELIGQKDSPLYLSLLNKEQLIRTMETLQTPNIVIRTASNAPQVQPTPLRNGVIGLFLGIVLGLGLAFLRDVLDTRVRSAEEVGERLALPLLARLPEPPQRIRNENKLSMLEEPDGIHAEAFRVLRTNLDFVNLDRGARVLMVTSALEAEGKSTTVANLAVACARAGRHVIAIDLDMRRPYLDKLLGVGKRPGLTQVALDQMELEEALVPIAFTEPRRRRRLSEEDWAVPAIQAWDSNGHSEVEGVLEILPAGPVPPDVGEFVGSRTLAEILTKLRDRADIVIVDSPPLLRVGDAITLSGQVDAMLIVTNLASARRPVLAELRRVLERCPADKLGFVLTGASLDEGYGYGYGGYYYRTPRTETETLA